MKWKTIKIVAMITLIVLGAIASIYFLYCSEVKEREDYKKNHTEDIELFENYTNNSFKKESEYIIIAVELRQYNIQKGDVAIRNYLSNVNGEILSEKEITSSNLSIARGVSIARTDVIYTLKIPKNAKLADNLEEALNMYLENSVGKD